jgi:hypothetical protein
MARSERFGCGVPKLASQLHGFGPHEPELHALRHRGRVSVGMAEYLTFIVRLVRSEADDVDGVVERVRTGEKARFRGLDALGPTIRRMLEGDVPGPPADDDRAPPSGAPDGSPA